MNNLVSIIVPVYNEEKYIARCIDSLLAQTHKNIQLILINDGSTDNSLEICKYYKSMDDRILLIDKPNEGVSAARNAGIQAADGDYIGFVDSDDHVDENMYELLVNKILDDKTDLCAMTSYTINMSSTKEGISANRTITNIKALKELFLLRFPTSLWAYLYKKDIIEDIYLNTELHFFEDFEFNYRVLSKSENVSLCDERLYNYDLNEGSINSQSINDKRITCLFIYDMILDKVKRDYKELLIYTQCFRAHFLSSIIISIIKSKRVDAKYFNIIKNESRNMLIDILVSRYVPTRYKIAIAICALNPKFLYRIMYYER